MLTSFSCKEEDAPPCACGIENPQENLEWLNHILQKRFCTDVYSVKFQGQEYIGIYDCDDPDTYDNGCVFYDCSGNLFCQYIGFTGQWDCSDEFKEATKKKLIIYKQKTNSYWDK